MRHSDAFIVHRFVRNFLHRLCKRDVASFNPSHDPGLRALWAVKKCLEEKIKNLTYEDLAYRVYRGLFMPDPISGVFGEMALLLAESPAVQSHFVFGEGTTFGFSAYKYIGWRRNDILGVIDLADELAEVFVKAYKGNLSGE